MNIRKNLIDRHIEFDRYNSIIIDDKNNIATFLLYNFSGKLVGFQKYDPSKKKMLNNDPDECRYFTHITPESNDIIKKAHQQLGVWGIETFHYRNDVLFVTEGIFKSSIFHKFNIPSISTLTNDIIRFSNWLWILSKTRRIIIVGDNDEGSTRTISRNFDIIFPPNHVKDVDELNSSEFLSWIKLECM